MAEQVSPLTTKWNVLQLVIIPAWYGVGVVTPFPFVVVVAILVVEVASVELTLPDPLITPTHT